MGKVVIMLLMLALTPGDCVDDIAAGTGELAICAATGEAVHPAWLVDGRLIDGVYNGEYVLKYGPHFRIFNTTDLPRWYINYEIFNHTGETVRSFTATRSVRIEYINESVLKIGISVGTATWTLQFYCVVSDTLSEVFHTPTVITDGLIGYVRWYDDALSLVVRDIFDTEVYYNEFFLEGLANIAGPILGIEYSGDGRIQVEYVARTGEDFHTKTVVLEL